MIGVLALIVLDYATGLIKAIVSKNVSSRIMRVGMWHKFAYILTVSMAELLEWLNQHVDLGYVIPLVPLVCGGIVLIEVSSIIENLGEINPELKDSSILQLFNINK
jgi:phage-related holin